MKIIFATGNQNKVDEVKILMPKGVELVSLKEIGYTEDIEETGATIEENSILKARVIFEKFRLPTLAEDTGLEVEALNNAPGVYSARYAGPECNSEKNIDLLLQNLKGEKNRNASFKTIATFLDENSCNTFEGTVLGKILHERKGIGGFGYDPVFQPDGFSKSFAEFSKEEKGQVSHRGIAIRKFLKFISGKNK